MLGHGFTSKQTSIHFMVMAAGPEHSCSCSSVPLVGSRAPVACLMIAYMCCLVKLTVLFFSVINIVSQYIQLNISWSQAHSAEKSLEMLSEVKNGSPSHGASSGS